MGVVHNNAHTRIPEGVARTFVLDVVSRNKDIDLLFEQPLGDFDASASGICSVGIHHDHLTRNFACVCLDIGQSEIRGGAEMGTGCAGAVCQGNSDTAYGLLSRLDMDHNPLDMGNVGPDGRFDLVADLMGLVQRVDSEAKRCLDKTIPAGIPPDQRLDLDHRWLLGNNPPRLSEGVGINRGIKQHAHAIGQCFPPDIHNPADNQNSCWLVERPPYPLSYESGKDYSRR